MTGGELKRAWDLHRQDPEFEAEFRRCQEAFAASDLDYVARQIRAQAVKRAHERSDAVQALRS